jgi:hypothetical protein
MKRLTVLLYDRGPALDRAKLRRKKLRLAP